MIVLQSLETFRLPARSGTSLRNATFLPARIFLLKRVISLTTLTRGPVEQIYYWLTTTLVMVAALPMLHWHGIGRANVYLITIVHRK